jgi:hypothetical protein
VAAAQVPRARLGETLTVAGTGVAQVAADPRREGDHRQTAETVADHGLAARNAARAHSTASHGP